MIFLPKKEKNYKDSTLNKSNRTLFCYRTINEASKFTENDDSVEKKWKPYFVIGLLSLHKYGGHGGHTCKKIKLLILM